MNEENKYYTPEIEEFYYGFEFEQLYIHDLDDQGEHHETEWRKEILNSDIDIKYIKKKLEYDEFRVKILDKKDIESLGFTLIETFSSPYTKKELYTFILTKERGFNTSISYYLTINDNDITIKTVSYSSYGTFKYQMNFVIKNKSELQKLLKMIGIDE